MRPTLVFSSGESFTYAIGTLSTSVLISTVPNVALIVPPRLFTSIQRIFKGPILKLEPPMLKLHLNGMVYCT
ncbi:uncharacterized protein BO80DRAFT_69727 [Aspergillus ibericus CBS 121593]|uniref:Uncharacterized protein n=1 Tax=Aspergillus ibericus CBS 121593 TaxID=1448316 RepID=A0A395H1I0_9EURO|nr:hypothetical protein BO80DRAFT_69727 [Aspergillus ibericus CBS 121593]RAL01075.1 hypothetical protein BO80DRAFT_69727 [Aspergillus ibericus CBS 121593]